MIGVGASPPRPGSFLPVQLKAGAAGASPMSLLLILSSGQMGRDRINRPPGLLQVLSSACTRDAPGHPRCTPHISLCPKELKPAFACGPGLWDPWELGLGCSQTEPLTPLTALLQNRGAARAGLWGAQGLTANS